MLVLGTALITILCCLIGLYYNISGLKAVISKGHGQPEEIEAAPFIWPAFYTMSAICIAFYLCLIGFSIDLIGGSSRAVVPFAIVMFLEAVYLVGVGALWKHPTIGYSFACASGIANGGLMVQFIIALPLWAPFILWMAK